MKPARKLGIYGHRPVKVLSVGRDLRSPQPFAAGVPKMVKSKVRRDQDEPSHERPVGRTFLRVLEREAGAKKL